MYDINELINYLHGCYKNINTSYEKGFYSYNLTIEFLELFSNKFTIKIYINSREYPSINEVISIIENELKKQIRIQIYK